MNATLPTRLSRSDCLNTEMSMVSNKQERKYERKCLTLEERMKCIKLLESGKSCRALAREFGVGKTQVQNVLKRKREIMDEFESNGNILAKRLRKESTYSEVNNLTYQWYLDVSLCMLPVSGPMIKEKAKQIAADLGLTSFKASNGWLESFQKRNNIVLKGQSVEQGVEQGVEQSVEQSEIHWDEMQQWLDRLPLLCKGYEPKNIFNMDETGLLFKDSTKFCNFQKGEICPDGERSNMRLTLALCVSMTGEKLRPVVIGKASKPGCFGSLSLEALPVHYYANNKAWMLPSVMEDWLKHLDAQMRKENRKILLFLDNAPVHPNISLTHVKLQFFPANVTTLFQPLNAGIFQSFKLKYRKRQLYHVLVEMDNDKTKTSPEILKDISILQAIYWVSTAWQETTAQTIANCFVKCGFRHYGGVNDCPDANSEEEGDVLLALLRMSHELFSEEFQDLATIDDQLATHDFVMNSQNLPVQKFFSNSSNQSHPCHETASDDDAEYDEPKFVTSTEAGKCFTKLKVFAAQRNQPELLDLLMKAEGAFVKYQVKSIVKVKQTDL